MLYVRRDDVPLVLKLVMRGFPAPEEESKMGAFVDDEALLAAAEAAEVPYPLQWTSGVVKVPGVKHIYHTTVSSVPLVWPTHQVRCATDAVAACVGARRCAAGW